MREVHRMLKIFQKFFAFCSEENRNKFYRAILRSVLESFLEALRIPAIALVLNDILRGTISMRTVWLALGIMLVSVLGAGYIRQSSTMLQTEAGYGTCADKRIEIAEHMRYLPMGYFNKKSVGSITSVTTNTMQNLENVATRVVLLVTGGLLTTLMMILMIMIFDWRIGLIVFVGFLLFMLANNRLQHASEKNSKLKLDSDQEMVTQVLEYVQGITEVKTFHLVGQKSRALHASVNHNRDVNVKMELSLVPDMALQSMVAKLTRVAMAMASVGFYLNGSMSLLYCLVMMIASFMILSTLEQAGSYSALLRIVDLSVDLANEILESDTMDIDGKEMKPASFDLHVDDIHFSYGDKKIIDGITLDIPQNTTTAIVGPSGGGKTTFTNLLARFWDVDSGYITLGGQNIKNYSMDSLMENFSFVFQNVYLFHDTIANNIRFSNPDASMEDVIEASKKACCHDFITQLPDGYDTVLGEQGISLSGGEKQRLSIARAIMKDAPIIILDEATANVDPEGEAELVQAIQELTKEKTIIMIAHRLKTVRHADQIVVIDQGKIVQKGRHQELVKEEGIYRNFINERNKAISWRLSL